MARAGALLALVRWPGAVTAAGNALTGFLLAHRPESPGGRRAAFGALLAAVLVYAGGVVLNDVADADRDRTLHPGRPIPSGAVDRRSAARFGILLLAAGVVAAALLANLASGALAAAAALFAVAYDFLAGRARWAAAPVLGAARAANAAAGATAAAGGAAWLFESASLPSRAQAQPAALLLYATLLTWTSVFEEGRARRALPGLAALVLLLAASAPWIAYAPTRWPEAPGIPLLLLLGSLAVAARTAMEPDGPGLGALVRAGVFGFLLVDAAWLMSAGRYEAGFWWMLSYVVLRLVLVRARS